MRLGKKKPILITGAHRSGSTWVGKMISASSKVRYVHEPFNIGRSVLPPPFQTWFQYLDNKSDTSFQKRVLKYLKLFLDTAPVAIIKTTPFLKGPKRFLVEYRSRWIRRTVFKDPIALMAAPWLFENLDCQVVVLVRHPAAFVASLKVKDWKFDFDHFLSQERLMKTHLSEFSEEIKNYSEKPIDIVSQGILLWNCFYKVVLEYKKEWGEEWYFAVHEELSKEPLVEFKKIYTFLDIPWGKHVEEQVLKTTKSTTESNHVRDSLENIHTWKNRLSEEEIERIKLGTQNLWPYFYSETNW